MTNYETAINSLIKTAEATADAKCGKCWRDRTTGKINKKYPSHDDWAEAWNVIFHGEMSRLAHEAGLRNIPVGRK